MYRDFPFSLLSGSISSARVHTSMFTRAKDELRLIVSKTAEQNVALIRGLLRLEKSDRIRFEDEQGSSVVPDYCGLKDTAGYKVKIMVFIERNDGELLERLAHERKNTI
jgi:hypothetical protein